MWALSDEGQTISSIRIATASVADQRALRWRLHSPLQINKSNSLSQIHLTLSFLISLEAPAKRRSNFTALGMTHRQAMCSAVSPLYCTTTTTENDAEDQLSHLCRLIQCNSPPLTHCSAGSRERRREREHRDQHSTVSSASSSLSLHLLFFFLQLTHCFDDVRVVERSTERDG